MSTSEAQPTDEQTSEEQAAVAPAEAQGVSGSTLQAAIGPVEGDQSTFVPTAGLRGDTEQREGETRVDYLNRLSRGSAMDRAF